MALLGDRVQETTTSTGTGSITLNGAVTGYVTFNSTFSNGNSVWYVIDDGAGNWEIGTGTVGTGTLTRSVFQSSNANALVPFGVGTKRIFCTAPYTYLLPDMSGNSGKFLTTNGTVASWADAGTVTSVSVVSANGFAGTSSGGTTPALTLSTTITGVLKGNGTAISAAVAGTDYAGLASANTFTNNQVISVSSASDALRITQTGAGNALLVEDSANPDSTPFVVDANGNLVVGKTTARTNYFAGSTTPSIQGASFISTDRGGAFSAGPAFVLAKNRGNIGENTIVQSGDSFGQVSFQGADGTNLIPAASIEAFVDGTPGTNDMPGRLVFSTTADGASSPTERMRIGSDGGIGIGGTNFAGYKILNTGSWSGATTFYGVASQGTIQSGVTAASVSYRSAPNTAAAAFTLASLQHYIAEGGTIGAGSTITNQFGFYAISSLTGATNNYGFYSNIASGTGRWNFYAAGTADNYFAGKVGIGSAAATGENFSITKNVDTTATAFGIRNLSYVNQATTTAIYGISDQTQLLSPAAITDLIRFYAAAGSFTGTATNQYGFFANSNLTGATNNYGFYSSIASGTGRYNFYASGTADNYFAGNVGIGTSSPGAKLTVAAAEAVRLVNATPYLSFYNAAQSTRYGYIQHTGTNLSLVNEQAGSLNIYTNNTIKATIDSSGNLGLGITPSAYAGLVAGRLEVGSVGNSLFSNGSTNFWLTTNTNYNSGYKYATTGVATMYLQSAGSHQWFTAPSGTAGNAISFTQAMTLDASGNLGIGTSSPASPYRLSITGNGSSIVGGLALTSNGNTAYIGQVVATSADCEYWNAANGYVRIGTNNTERARIDASGNLLVGGTTASGVLTVTAANTAKSVSIRSGASELMFTQGQTATSVTTSATAILPASFGYGALAIVNGYSGGNIFADLVFFTNTTTAAVSSQTVGGSPVARTYSVVSGQLKLAMASGTYTVTAIQQSINAY